MIRRPPRSPLFPSPPLSRSRLAPPQREGAEPRDGRRSSQWADGQHGLRRTPPRRRGRSEEHTSELQSQSNLVCRLLLEKKKKNTTMVLTTHQCSTTFSGVAI